ncbi:disease resistance protein RUN1-like [Carya illinoinensis]|nr:disease resistance protein RUN1-like [Carya illinoinensis]
MASTSTQTASSSSSPSEHGWENEVFLSFYGKDTRMGFTDHLYADLTRKGIIAFRDDEKLQRGENISEELLKAVQESLYAIVVMSRNFAFSKWCLMELAEIVKCMGEKRLTVYPIFYHVDPSDVRNQTGTFEKAFSMHEESLKVDKEKMQARRDALTAVGNISGWHLHDRLCVAKSNQKQCASSLWYPQSQIITINPATTIFEKLTSATFPQWRAQFEALLIGYDLIDFVTGHRPCPAIDATNSAASKAAYSHWVRQDKLLLHAILASTSPTITPILASCKTSQQAWSLLTRLYAGKSRTRALQLKENLTLSTRGSNTVTEFLQAIKMIADELAIIDHHVSDDDLTLYILNGLGPEFREIAAPIRARETSMTFEEIHDLLALPEIIGLLLRRSTSHLETRDVIKPKAVCFLFSDYKKLVGIDSSVKEMMNLLGIGLDDVRFLGIHGMSGIGKTTLARVIYERVSCQFKARSFITCGREETKNGGLVDLQKQLLSMITGEEINVWDDGDGINVIRKRLHKRKVFVILDDVDSEKQLEGLAGSHDWFGIGSRIIITRKDGHLLKRHVSGIYKVKELNEDEAWQLFSLSAFKKPHPTENYVDMSNYFVNYAQGLPLALKVLGSFLFGRTQSAWRSAWDQLQENPNEEILDVLQIGFDGLEYLQKKLFLDIACFFEGEKLDTKLMDVLESFGYYPGINLDVLMDKSLITISYGKLSMHDLLRKMGREIVRRECPEDRGRRTRLWCYEDILRVLKSKNVSD